MEVTEDTDTQTPHVSNSDGQELRNDSGTESLSPTNPNPEECSTSSLAPPSRVLKRPTPCDADDQPEPGGVVAEPSSRQNLHNTMNRLINIVRTEKGTANVTTVNTNEQAIRNKYISLLWLEANAKLLGKTLLQHHNDLQEQRKIVMKALDIIIGYRFVNTSPCRPKYHNRGSNDTSASKELVSYQSEDTQETNKDEIIFTCETLDCEQCFKAIGRAMREVGALLDLFKKASFLYQSDKEMIKDYPLVGTDEFQYRISALTAWFNGVCKMRINMLGMKRDVDERIAWEKKRQNMYNVSTSSDPNGTQNESEMSQDSSYSSQESSGESTSPNDEEKSHEVPKTGDDEDDVEEYCNREVIDAALILEDNLHDADVCYEYSELGDERKAAKSMRTLAEIIHRHLKEKHDMASYKQYYMSKMKGVRNCLVYVHKLRHELLRHVYLALEKPDLIHPDLLQEGNGRVFSDLKNVEDKYDIKDEPADHPMFDIHNYGCWSEPCIAMGLPSFRSTFLLLSSVCIEAVNEYLCSRLQNIPPEPSYFTVLQLIDELRESLEVSSELRADFARHLRVGLGDHPPSYGAAVRLQQLLKDFDLTIEQMLKQYLLYLTTVSDAELVTLKVFQDEWAFTSRLAKRMKCAADLAPLTFVDITCYQLNKLLNEFNELSEEPDTTPDTIVPRLAINSMLQSVKTFLVRHQDTVLKTAQWARMLSIRLAQADDAFQEDREQIFNCMMAIRDTTLQHIFNLGLSKPDTFDISAEWKEYFNKKIWDVLLDLFHFGFELHKDIHRMVNGSLNQPEVTTSSPPARRLRLTPAEHMEHDGEEQQGGDDVTAEVGAATKGWNPTVAGAVTEFATCWMMFVIAKCRSGRGYKPKWTSEGLQFLSLATDARNTVHLSEDKFKELRSSIDDCMAHLVGADSAPLETLLPKVLTASIFDPFTELLPGPSRDPQQPGTLKSDVDYEQNLVSYAERRRRVLNAIQHLDDEVERRTRRYMRLGYPKDRPRNELRLPQVAFKWQRGQMIGRGGFGKVYAVVNTETGQSLAMKELSIKTEQLKEAINELRILEGINHPHLVKCFGCELHRDKMLLFMELCTEGSLETLVVKMGPLPEQTVRVYTFQLLSALRVLHFNSIVHRDIKTANIFMAQDNKCVKLGDFGCAVRLRAYHTARGELVDRVGTDPYTAPEVFYDKTGSGYGRAADVYSLGCVVTEMASGERPFEKYEHGYHIMLAVHKGERPAIPSWLSDEGHQFCQSCFRERNDRPDVDELLQHHFVMLQKADDQEFKPGYFLSADDMPVK
ncbi:mitogen-activated protein kinase kinase kinase 4-like [Anticarsia gemmatalis]|uniref:mitogen-activated protein kinase kinase kinase 4-like n=1 Tax=Anticarsia gemmatalis TaxID=129554 RepID=UPI003F76E0D7